MSDQSENFTEQSAAFQKIWLESMSKLMQAAFTFTPNSAPPELLRQIRSGILQALAESWNEFLRSPQFQEGMKQWMDSAVAFRKMSNDFMGKVRKEMQAPSRDDIDAVMLAVRHMETRILDRLEELTKQLNEFQQQRGPAPTRSAIPEAKGRKPRPAKIPQQRGSGKEKAGTP
jgi:hypothetical protein